MAHYLQRLALAAFVLAGLALAPLPAQAQSYWMGQMRWYDGPTKYRSDTSFSRQNGAFPKYPPRFGSQTYPGWQSLFGTRNYVQRSYYGFNGYGGYGGFRDTGRGAEVQLGPYTFRGR
jgi:hypothetical protein